MDSGEVMASRLAEIVPLLGRIAGALERMAETDAAWLATRTGGAATRPAGEPAASVTDLSGCVHAPLTRDEAAALLGDADLAGAIFSLAGPSRPVELSRRVKAALVARVGDESFNRFKARAGVAGVPTCDQLRACVGFARECVK